MKYFKARLIIRDFTQQFGVNYEDIFVSIIYFKSLWVLFIIIIKEKLIIYFINIQNIYLNLDFNKKIYMKVLKNIKINKNKIYLLLKSLYSLK